MKEKDVDFMFGYLREAYRFQIERMDKIRERISFVSGFLFVMGAGLSSLLNTYRFTWRQHPWRDSFFLVFFTLAVAQFIVSATFTAICLLRRFQYAGTRSTADVYAAMKELQAYNEHPQVSEKIDISLRIKTQLCTAYTTATEFNQKLNTFRNDLIIQAMRWGVSAALLTIIPVICNVAQKYDGLNNPIQVRVLDPVNIKIK